MHEQSCFKQMALLRNSKVHLHVLTTDNIKSTESDVTEAVKLTFSCQLVQLFHQKFCLLVHHLQEVRQDGKVEGRGQYPPALLPLFPCANQRNSEGLDMGFYSSNRCYLSFRSECTTLRDLKLHLLRFVFLKVAYKYFFNLKQILIH